MDTDKVAHLWRVNQFITKLNRPQSTNLQTFYIQKCKNLSQGIKLPFQNFGPSVMCTYCGSLWTTVDHNIRILRGRSLSKSIRKIICCMKEGNKKISKVQKSLAKRCMKNQANTLVLKCSVCSKSTKIRLVKPERKSIQFNSESVMSSKKRKKKKVRDRAAGLNISAISNLSMENVESSKEISVKTMSSNKNFITPTQKLKKLNVKRLKDIVNQGVTPPKRTSLHSFLSELC